MMEPITTFKRLWPKFAEGKGCRSSFVKGFIKRELPAQIKAVMKQRGFTQQKLADESGLTQGEISRVVNPAYGDMTLNTLLSVASGLDCAIIVKLVPFSEFISHIVKEGKDDVPSFEEE